MPAKQREAESSVASRPSALLISAPEPVDAPYHLQLTMSKEFFFLTVPGVVRLLEILVAGLNIGTFGYYCTFYDKADEDTISPIFLANTREAFFFIANSNTFLSAFYVIFASLISIRSHAALMGSLFMFIFDFIQFLLVVSSSVGLIFLYMNAEAKTIYRTSLQTRQGLAVAGMLLACLHLIGCIYDLGVYVRRIESIAEPCICPELSKASTFSNSESNDKDVP